MITSLDTTAKKTEFSLAIREVRSPMTRKKLHFTIDENQHKNLFDLVVGIFTVTVVILTLTFGNNSNSQYQQNQEMRSLPQVRSPISGTIVPEKSSKPSLLR